MLTFSYEKSMRTFLFVRYTVYTDVRYDRYILDIFFLKIQLKNYYKTPLATPMYYKTPSNTYLLQNSSSDTYLLQNSSSDTYLLQNS